MCKLNADCWSNIHATVTAKRKKDVSLLVPISYRAPTKSKKQAIVVELGYRKSKYSYFVLEHTVDVYVNIF